jgi:hypothetical protein
MKMKKIHTIFKIDWTNGRKVTDIPNPDCQWVFDGEGIATKKWDGTACLWKEGILYKRYDRKKDKKTGEYKNLPEGWFPSMEPDEQTGHWTGWMPIDKNNPSDKWHVEALLSSEPMEEGTYEFCGPKIQGNPENLSRHTLIQHGWKHYKVKREYESIKRFLEENEIEGLVFHHDDGRMAKIKRRDFDLPWPIKKTENE